MKIEHLARDGRDITDWMAASDEPDDDLISILIEIRKLQRDMMEDNDGIH